MGLGYFVPVLNEGTRKLTRVKINLKDKELT